jgi:branched-subunit amino acid aminotransferase/4-amino-4-deoxychorismate lyase
MATLLLKKSYQLSNLKEVTFKDLWGSRGVFTTMRMVGKPPKLILLKPHIENLIKSTRKYGIRKKNLKNIIKDLVDKNNLYKSPDTLFRIALNKKLISVSIRKRPKPKNNFNLLLFKYKRVEPNYKNLYYKKILAKLSKVDSTKFDIALVSNNNILETGTSNLVFVKNGKIFSPKKNCYFGNTIKYINHKVKIFFKNISINNIK